MPQRSAEDWKRIRVDYEAGRETIAAIAAREGVNVASIHRQARRHGWRSRRAGDQGAAWRDRVLAELRWLAEELGQSVTAVTSAGASPDMPPGASPKPASKRAPKLTPKPAPKLPSKPLSEDSHGGSARDTDAGLGEVERRVKLLQSLVRSVQALARLEGADGARGAHSVGSRRATIRQDDRAEDNRAEGDRAKDDHIGDDDIAAMRRELERRLDRAVGQG